MKLTTAELAFVRSLGLFIRQKCGGCGKLLNQSFRYTISGKAEIYCSAACRDRVFFGDRWEAQKRSTPGKCVYCGASLQGKRPGALYCDAVCRMRADRRAKAQLAREDEKSRTPTQPNQGVADVKMAG